MASSTQGLGEVRALGVDPLGLAGAPGRGDQIQKLGAVDKQLSHLIKFIECSLCARPCARCWGSTGHQAELVLAQAGGFGRRRQGAAGPPRRGHPEDQNVWSAGQRGDQQMVR